jgi:hypothetical protein
MMWVYGRSLVLVVAAGALSSVPGLAQNVSYSIDASRSLVWWQLDPHYGHLWATSCPRDPSWQPGEGHSAGYYINYKSRPKIRTTKESENRVPLFPRDTVRANCRPAISGSFRATDVRRFANLKGVITVAPDSITNGSDSRDKFADRYVYGSAKYPTIKFTIDSVTSVNIVGDTINAVAVGTFVLRDIEKLTRVQVQGIRDGNRMRVRGMFAMPARELRDKYGISPIALGVGVGLKLWDTLFMGFDLILNEQTGGGS